LSWNATRTWPYTNIDDVKVGSCVKWGCTSSFCLWVSDGFAINRFWERHDHWAHSLASSRCKCSGIGSEQTLIALAFEYQSFKLIKFQTAIDRAKDHMKNHRISPPTLPRETLTNHTVMTRGFHYRPSDGSTRGWPAAWVNQMIHGFPKGNVVSRRRYWRSFVPVREAQARDSGERWMHASHGACQNCFP